VVSLLALAAAVGTSAEAQTPRSFARAAALISGKAIKPGSIPANRLSKPAVASLRGHAGPAGAQGPKGDAGPQGTAGDAGPAGPTGPPGQSATALWGVIESNGNEIRGSHVSTSSTIGMGAYSVIFDRDVTTCGFVATVGVTGFLGNPIGYATVAGSPVSSQAVTVHTFGTAGAAANLPFHVAVFC
jgi:hypothetical protein